MKFDKKKYLSCITDVPRNISNVRRVERGFANFVAGAADIAICMSNASTPSIVELGIGGGGSQLNWKEHLDGNVFGIDLFDRNMREYYQSAPNFGHYRDNFDRICADTDQAKQFLNAAGVISFWGVNAYTSQASELVIKANNNTLVDFVLDDAAPGTGMSLAGLMPSWKSAIASTGCIVSETPYGNGTSAVYNLSKLERDNYIQQLSDLGMIVFDMREYSRPCDPPFTDYIISDIALFAHDYNLYKDLIDKFYRNIIAGKTNLPQ